MSLRKEQVLAILALLLGAYFYSKITTTTEGRTIGPRNERYEAGALPVPPLVDPDADPALLGRPMFVEPSETKPLPPRELPLPPERVFGVLALPLPAGPGPSWAHLLEIAGAPDSSVQLSDASADSGGDGSQDAGATGPATDENLARTYDRVIVGVSTWWGILEPVDGKDKFDIALMSQADLLLLDELPLRRYDRSRGRLLENPLVFRPSGGTDKIDRIVLADNMRNRVGLEKRKRAGDYSGTGLPKLYDLADWLIEQGRQETWVYDEALDLSDTIVQISQGSLQAWRLKQRILRVRGDLEGELALYASLPTELQGSAFQLRGRGELRAFLGLWEDAEADLRAAIAADPQNPESFAALGRFLLSRSREADALDVAERAWRFRGTARSDEVRWSAGEVYARVLLRNGALDTAGAVIAELDASREGGKDYFKGALVYAGAYSDPSVSIADAGSAFESASAAAGSVLAADVRLGQAAAALRQKDWNGALAGFRSVAQAAPLLRHYAVLGMALVYERAGQLDRALSAVEQALVLDPSSWYAYYLRGHCLRLRGEHTAAIEAFDQCLRLEDDVLHVLLEVILCHEAIAAEGAAPENLLRAMRYANRLVALSSERGGDFRFDEVRGRVNLRARELRTADRSFAEAEGAAQEPPDQLYARSGRGLVLYAQGRVGDARDTFLAIQDSVGRGNPFWDYAEEILQAIDDHSQKVQLVETFDRDGFGSKWRAPTGAGRTKFLLRDGAACLQGSVNTAGTVLLRDDNDVPEAGKFLGIETNMRVSSQDSATITGVRLQRESAGRGVTVTYGMKGRSPYLMVRDGSARTDPEPVPGLGAKLPGLDPSGEHRIALYFEPEPDNERSFNLVAVWNGVRIHQQKLSGITSSTRTPLQVGYISRALPRGKVDVAFDNLRLLRREPSK